MPGEVDISVRGCSGSVHGQAGKLKSRAEASCSAKPSPTGITSATLTTGPKLAPWLVELRIRCSRVKKSAAKNSQAT